MILGSLRCLEFLIVLLVRSDSRSSNCYGFRSIEMIEYSIRSLLMLRQNNLRNGSAGVNSLTSHKWSIRWHWSRIQNIIVWNIQVFVENAFQLAPNKFIVRLIFVVKTLKMIENVLNFLNVFCHNPKFLFRIIQTFCLNVLDLIHC